MAQLSLQGLQFAALSPSYFLLVGWPIALAFDPLWGWRVAIRGQATANGYRTRDDAARALARAMGAGT